MTPGISWKYASLTLDQPGWPGTKPAMWVAVTADGEQFRCADVLQAMTRLGEKGWELAGFFPETGDRSSSFFFKSPS
jgi:hypothetical protein